MKQLERQVDLEALLPAVLAGKSAPASAADGVDLAAMCLDRHRPVRGLGLYVAAFRAEPKLLDDLKAQHRYNAACAAGQALAGQGDDVSGLQPEEHLALSRQARAWLRADLAACARATGEANSKARQAVAARLRHWQQDSDLAAVREPASLAGLPEDERGAWRKLWADVGELLKHLAEAGR